MAAFWVSRDQEGSDLVGCHWLQAAGWLVAVDDDNDDDAVGWLPLHAILSHAIIHGLL